MKILFVISCLSYGGAEKNLMLLADYFKQNNDVAICNFNEQETVRTVDSRIDYFEQTRHIQSDRKNDWFSKRKAQYNFLSDVCRTFEPDIMISFLPIPNAIAVLCGRKMHIPVIISERADPYQKLSRIDSVIHFIYGFADGAVFQTEGARDFYRKKLREKSVVIPNPVILPSDMMLHDFDESEKTVACVGRFENKQKRQDVAIKAMALVHEKHPDYRMVFWGDGPDMDMAKFMVKEMSAEDYIVFPGVSQNTLRDIRNSELYLLTSDYEGIPNTLIEAMSLGIPCIATDCSPGGARMLLENGRNGIICKCGKPDEIAYAVISMIENKEKAKLYAQNARDSLKRFSYDSLMEKWNQFILKVANKRE